MLFTNNKNTNNKEVVNTKYDVKTKFDVSDEEMWKNIAAFNNDFTPINCENLVCNFFENLFTKQYQKDVDITTLTNMSADVLANILMQKSQLDKTKFTAHNTIVSFNNLKLLNYATVDGGLSMEIELNFKYISYVMNDANEIIHGNKNEFLNGNSVLTVAFKKENKVVLWQVIKII